MTHTLEQTRGILQQIQCGMGPLPPGFDLETLVCQTVSAVAADCVEHVFVLEPPRQFIHVRGEAADLIQALSGVLHALTRLSPGGSSINIWTFAQVMNGRNWVAVRIRENEEGLRRDGAEVARAMEAITAFVESMGANLEVAWDSTGTAELSVWLPCFNLVEFDDAMPGEQMS
ncbi:hypothetical protein [Nitrogeniibacter aestuarii]|uniref:hypothetical protein n=1 Tax=Nitrogeniibacter aestuarii TaxID=2815343 RepID=UPI001E61AB02|nr:hypothetical protein [Nitrogeniibacter aestuarii]